MHSNRYMVFAYDAYYPCGGMGDCVGMYQTYDAALAVVEKLLIKPQKGGGDIFDIETGVSHSFVLKCSSGKVEKIEEWTVAECVVLTTAPR